MDTSRQDSGNRDRMTGTREGTLKVDRCPIIVLHGGQITASYSYSIGSLVSSTEDKQ